MTRTEARERIRKQGPCDMCDNRRPYAAHRLIDAQMGRVSAGDSIESVAEDYREPSVPAMVMRWAAYIDLLVEAHNRTTARRGEA
jgi:hypothetical protein